MSFRLPVPGDVIGGKYRVESLLGKGGMSTVYAVKHQLTGRDLAVKWISPSLAMDATAVQRFVSEAQTASRIDHPNVVQVFDVGREGDFLFMVMERLRGEPLSARFARGLLSIGELARILTPALAAVEAAHAAQVIHRDLKPDNLFLVETEEGGTTKVLDFGVSKLLDPSREAVTKTGAILGTVQYMAPEQFRSSKHVDGRADIYSIGVVMYEALCGELPFEGTPYEIAVHVIEGKAQPLRAHVPEIDGPIDALVSRAMHRDPAQRFATASALSAALAPYLADSRPPFGERTKSEISLTDIPTLDSLADTPQSQLVETDRLPAASARDAAVARVDTETKTDAVPVRARGDTLEVSRAAFEQAVADTVPPAPLAKEGAPVDREFADATKTATDAIRTTPVGLGGRDESTFIVLGKKGLSAPVWVTLVAGVVLAAAAAVWIMTGETSGSPAAEGRTPSPISAASGPVVPATPTVAAPIAELPVAVVPAAPTPASSAPGQNPLPRAGVRTHPPPSGAGGEDRVEGRNPRRNTKMKLPPLNKQRELSEDDF